MSGRIKGINFNLATFKTAASFFVFAVLAAFMAVNFTACGEEQQGVPEIAQMHVSSPKTQPIVPVETFNVPSSSVISAEKAKFYAKASAGLVELGYRWSERIDKANDSEKILILNAYNVARDQLCARVGLAGVAEFNWITSVALPDPKNKAVFESVGLRPNN
ncbi:hypothetical protein [Fibrobacter sp. HC4]|uniref:hypothetical protein n=1 Tax=Fibrobacter sp. HC4 TaxID=3239812 RepID=UPI0020185155|nr:hypothetical protein [Fibrobacter succinogenes]MCL4102782.1 hypothetical protein [Fibrobacter succinogenes]